MGRIRVLHSLESVSSGGVEQRRLSLARHLDPQIYEQQLICTKAIKSLPTQFEEAGCKITEVGAFRSILDLPRYKSALRVIREFRPHIIHGAVFEGVAMSAIAGTLGRVPVIIGEETSNPINRSWRGNFIYKGITALTHHMVAVSPAVEIYLTEKIGLARDKVSVIPNGVSEKKRPSVESTINLRIKLGLTEKDFVIGTVGRLFDRSKRVSDIIKAMPLIVQNTSNAKLLVVGTGPDEPQLRELAKSLGLTDKILFVGYQSDTRQFYELMDVFVLASAHEAFGLVLVEAMFSRLPVVATRVGGIPKVVVDGETAFLCDPFSPSQIADKVIPFFKSAALRKTFGDAGKERARKYFSENRYVTDVSQLYQKLLNVNKVQD
ncbi:glycosyltransferase [Alcanivorax sp.]|uniref:glycosyltransferase n=1 Tax=Alcanivorax sp. TaxID=1872427 RepID=UPI003BAACF45